MSRPRPFRFAVYGSGYTRAAWADYARKVESLGYSTLLTADHITEESLAPLPALLTAADATTTLRLGTHVLVNDFRHPALVAHEAATVDLLSDGRLELGLGSGWMREEYERTGLTYDAARVRVDRLAEAFVLIKRLFQEDSVTYAGEHYRVRELNLRPKPLQRPHPPMMIAGGGKRMLSLAAREATIVGLAVGSITAGKLDAATTTADAVAEKVGWIREAAGPRLSALELHIQTTPVITDDRRRGAEVARANLAALSGWAVNTDRSAAEMLESPHALIGSIDQIVETLQERRERYGISYITVFGDIDAFSLVVARLAGK